jgi:hypothetical protein
MPWCSYDAFCVAINSIAYSTAAPVGVSPPTVSGCG